MPLGEAFDYLIRTLSTRTRMVTDSNLCCAMNLRGQTLVPGCSGQYTRTA